MRAARLLLAAAAAALVGAGAPPPVPPGPERPVMVGGMADLDACLTVSKVTGLNPRGDNFLSLRSLPSTKGHELAWLRAGQEVWACDEALGGWTGVLVTPPTAASTAASARRSPIARPMPEPAGRAGSLASFSR